MSQLADHRGRFARLAQDPVQSRQIAALIRLHPCSGDDLRLVAEECLPEIQAIATNQHGSWFLSNLVAKLLATGCLSEVESLLSVLMTNKAIIGHQDGCKALFNVLETLPRNRDQLFSHLYSNSMNSDIMRSALLDMFPEKKSQLLSFFTSNIVELMMENGDLGPLFTRIMSFFNQEDLETLLTVIAGSAQLASSVNVNTIALIRAAAHILVSLASNLKGSLLLQKFISSFDPTVGDLIVEILQGLFMELSTKPYSNFVVQACFKGGSWRSCSTIARELDSHFHTLVTHSCGSYVVQVLIRRFKRERAPVPLLLLSLINNKRQVLRLNQYGKFVVYALDE